MDKQHSKFGSSPRSSFKAQREASMTASNDDQEWLPIHQSATDSVSLHLEPAYAAEDPSKGSDAHLPPYNVPSNDLGPLSDTLCYGVRSYFDFLPSERELVESMDEATTCPPSEPTTLVRSHIIQDATPPRMSLLEPKLGQNRDPGHWEIVRVPASPPREGEDFGATFHRVQRLLDSGDDSRSPLMLLREILGRYHESQGRYGSMCISKRMII